jgi:hypothetical protein
MTDETREDMLALTDEQIVTRRRVLGLAVGAVGAGAFVGRFAHADDMSIDTEGEDEDGVDITDGDVLGDDDEGDGDDMGAEDGLGDGEELGGDDSESDSDS